VAAAVPARGGMDDRRDLGLAPPARRAATAAAPPPEPELGGPGTAHDLFNHPQVGPLALNYEKLLIPGSDMQALVTYHAQPGSDSEERLRLLASITTTDPDPDTPARPRPVHPHTPTPDH